MNNVTKDEVKTIIRSILTSSPYVLTILKVQKDFEQYVGYKLPYKHFGYNTPEMYLRQMQDICEVKGTGPSAQVLPIITAKTSHINDMVTRQKVNTKKTPKMDTYLHKRPATYNGSHSDRQFQRASKSDIHRRSKSELTQAPKQIPQENKLKRTPDSTDNLKDNVSKGTNIPQNVQKNIQTLIGCFEEGIWCCDLPTTYKQMFKTELDFKNYGYNNLIEMCMELRHVFFCTRPGNDDFKLYDLRKPLPNNFLQTHTTSSWKSKDEDEVHNLTENLKHNCSHKDIEVSALPKLDWTDFHSFIPDDIYTLGTEIPKQFLPSDTKIGDELDVVVVEIYDPSKFWVYLGTSDPKTQLDDLMDRMQIDYSESETQKKYAVPVPLIQEGLYCAQVVFDEYHRVRIVQVLPDSKEVRVFCIDYGTVCKVAFNGLCFLKSKFAELPAQAIRCRLSNIAPKLKGHAWPSSSSIAFRQMVNRRDTKMKIGYVDWDEKYAGVFLADITDLENIQYINELLVNNGDAAWEDECKEESLLKPTVQCKVERLYLFPTFLELEFGFVPNSEEMLGYEELGVPIHLILPHYFLGTNEGHADQDMLEYSEQCFMETVRYNRKLVPLNNSDVNQCIMEPQCDFNFFGDLMEDLIAYNNEILPNETNSSIDNESVLPTRPVMDLPVFDWDEESVFECETSSQTGTIQTLSTSDSVIESDYDHDFFGENEWPTDLPSSLPTTDLPWPFTTDLHSPFATDLPSLSATDLPSHSATNLPASFATDLPSASITDLPLPSVANLPSASATDLPSSFATGLPSSFATGLPSASTAYLPSTFTTYLPSSFATDLPSPSSADLPLPFAADLPSASAADLPSASAANLPSPSVTYLPSAVITDLSSCELESSSTTDTDKEESSEYVLGEYHDMEEEKEAEICVPESLATNDVDDIVKGSDRNFFETLKEQLRDFDKRYNERPMPVVYRHITDLELAPSLSGKNCDLPKSRMPWKRMNSDIAIECTENNNQRRPDLEESPPVETKYPLNTDAEVHTTMRIEEYTHSSESDTDSSSSSSEDSSIYEETSFSSEGSSDSDSGECANNDDEPVEKDVSTQTDKNEYETIPFIPPPPGFTVPMFRHWANAASFVPRWPYYPPPFVPGCFAFPMAMSVPVFPQVTGNLMMFPPNRAPRPHPNIYDFLNMYPPFPGYRHQ